MKKGLIIIIFLILNKASLLCQNNGSFENWTAVTFGTNTYQEPSNWQTLNFLAQFGNPVSAFRVTGTDKYSGNYALKIVSVHYTNKLLPQLPDTFGLVYNGKVIITPPSISYGTPYTLRPQMFSFYAKYIPVGIDTGLVAFDFAKNTPSGRVFIARHLIKILPVNTYSLYEIPINYLSNQIPDTASIYFKPSNTDSLARQKGSAIFIDDVLFSGFVNIKENDAYASKIKIYPTPAANEITINAQFDEAETIEVIDINGKLVGTYKIQNYNCKINLHTFISGNYFVRFLNKQNTILTYGNFSVMK